MKKINEGLRPNDLRGMMLDIVSIDEYKSKIDDAAIVIAFYAKNKEAANDANRFIQKSYVDLLDTEVSSAPDQKGHYLVFVELLLNDKTAKNIADLCHDLSSLVDNKQWSISIRGEDAPVTLSVEKLQHVIDAKLKGLVESVLKSSGVNKVTISENLITASSELHSMDFTLCDYGPYEAVYARNHLSEAAVNMNPDALRGSRILKGFLGREWSVECLGERYAAHNGNTNSLLLISFEHLK